MRGQRPHTCRELLLNAAELCVGPHLSGFLLPAAGTTAEQEFVPLLFLAERRVRCTGRGPPIVALAQIYTPQTPFWPAYRLHVYRQLVCSLTCSDTMAGPGVKRAASENPPFSLAELKAAIPKHCFVRSNLMSFAYTVRRQQHAAATPLHIDSAVVCRPRGCRSAVLRSTLHLRSPHGTHAACLASLLDRPGRAPRSLLLLCA